MGRSWRRGGRAALVLVLLAAGAGVSARAAADPVECPAPDVVITNDPRLVDPIGVAVDGDGNTYVVDEALAELHRYDDTGAETLVVSAGDASPAFVQLQGVAVDASGNIYVADGGSDTVYRFDAAGNQTLTINASNHAPAPAFAVPRGVAADGSGNIYVADRSSATVYRFDAAGNQTLTINASNHAPAPAFGFVSGVAVDSSGDLYVGAGAALYRFDPTGAQTLIVDATHQPPTPAFAAFLSVAVDADDDVYVASSGSRAVHRLDPTGAQTLAITASNPPLVSPRGLAVDASGRISVADPDANGVYRFGADGLQQPGLTEPLPFFGMPHDVAVGEDGDLHVLDTATKAVHHFATDGTQVDTLLGFTATPTWFNPLGLEVDQDGNTYVADDSRDTVQRFDPSGAQTLLISASSHAPTPVWTNPTDVAVDADGNIWVVDASRRLYRFDPSGNQTLRIDNNSPSTPGFELPGDVTVDDAGNVYVVDDGATVNRILRFDPSGAITLEIEGPDATPDLFRPAGVSVDADGNIFVTDWGTNLLYRFDADGEQTLAYGNSSPTPPVPAFDEPIAVDVDGRGEVVVVDHGADAVHHLQVSTAEVAVTSEDTPDPVLQGQELTLTIEVSNAGPCGAQAMEVANEWPAGFTVTDATVPDGTTFDDETGVWTVPTDEAGGTTTLTVTGTADEPGTSTHTATLTVDPRLTVDTPTGNTATSTVHVTPIGSITIVENATPGPTDFPFTATGAGTAPFTLDDDSDPTLPDAHVFDDLTAGAYSVTQTAVAGWQLVGLVCDTGETTDLGTRTATIALTAGEDVTCTFTNTPFNPAVTVDVVADPTSVGPGEDVDYEVQVHNTGDVPLTGVTTTDADVADCVGLAIADVPVGQTRTAACSMTTRGADIPSTSNAVEVDTGQTGPALSAPAVVQVAIPPSSYTDVPEHAWYGEGLDWATWFELVAGFPGGDYRPGGPVTRAQVVNMAWTMVDAPDGAPPHGFGDVPSSAWYGPALDWAKDQGLVTGFPGNRYRPRNAVNRAQIVNMLWTMLGSPGGAPPHGFSDVPSSAWYGPALDWAKDQGLVTGFPGNRYRPQNPVNRAQIVSILHRVASTEETWDGWTGPLPSTVLF